MISAFAIGVSAAILYRSLIVQDNRNARYAFALILLNIGLILLKVVL